MLIEIKEDIFSANDFKGLNFLIQLATYKHRYNLFVDISLVNTLDYYTRLDEEDKSILENYFNRAVQNDEVPNYIISNAN